MKAAASNICDQDHFLKYLKCMESMADLWEELIECNFCEYRFGMCRIKLFGGLNGNFIDVEARICIQEHFFSWKTIFEGHVDHFRGLHGHEGARDSIGHRTSFNLFFCSLKKLHWFRRY